MISDTLEKIDDTLHVTICDNGFMVEISGRNKQDNYKTVKIVCGMIDHVYEVIAEASTLPRD